MSPAERVAKLKSDARDVRRRSDRPPRPPLRCLIREYRERLSLTLEDVGNAVGLTRQAVLAMESEKVCGVRSMLAVAKFFGVAVVDLWPDLGRRA